MALLDEVCVTIVGSGTGLPIAQRGSPCVTIRAESCTLVLDLGPGSLRELARRGLGLLGINIIGITHFHPDHTADLIHLLFATKHPKILAEREQLVLIGPTGLVRFVREIQRAYAPHLNLPRGLLIIEELQVPQVAPFTWKNLQFKVAKTKHTEESIAYRIENRLGKSIVYSGDTERCQELIELAKNADLLILEASFPDTGKVQGHLTPAEAGAIAAEAGVKRLVLTHLYPENLATDIGAACRRKFGGEITVASDHLALVI